MIVLLTGLPGTGKTTLLRRFLGGWRQDCFWIVSNEIRNEAGERIGFEASTSTADRGVFAHKEAIASEVMMGTYHVDIPAIDRLFSAAIDEELAGPPRLLVVDEIGRMQMLSPRFVESVNSLFESGRHLLATIRHGDEWTEPYKQHPDALVIEVTEENREKLPAVLETMFLRMEHLDALIAAQEHDVMRMAREYLQAGAFIQLQKLFKQALAYVVQGRVRQTTKEEWVVTGNHGDHQVRLSVKTRSGSCDCDLFLGAGIYKGRAGECSHIQAARIAGGAY